MTRSAIICGSLDLLYPYGDYFAVNVSSPNTPGLRDLQERDRLDALLAALQARLRERAATAGRTQPKPLLVKVAPDLDEAALDDMVEVCLARGASGLIAVNTTIARDALSAWVPRELREQSRRPERASAACARRGGGGAAASARGRPPADHRLRRRLHAATTRAACFDAGASLLQLYTSFIYEGPSVARDICRDLATAGG